MNLKGIKDYVKKWIDENIEEFEKIADYIWNNPELGLEEYKSSEKLISVLEKHGFSIKKGLAKMPTSFVAECGDGEPVVGINVEYDCLPGLSQKSDSVNKDPVINGGPGHGCGHNILGTTAVLAGIALRYALEEYNIEATVKMFGSPAEEQCVGKPFMGREGLYKDVDFFLDWHPWNYNRADYDSCNSYFNIKYHYKGRTAHGNAPWHGRSALDAALLSSHAIEMLREHIAPASEEAAKTINYSFPDVGPSFPSVVPDTSTLWVIGRFTSSEEMLNIISRIDKCSEAGALATETKVEKEFITATHEKIPNKTLAEIVHKNFEDIGVPNFTKEEHEIANKMQESLDIEPTGLDNKLKEFGPSNTALCDTSEFSWNAPYATFWMTMAPDGGWHNWMVTACAKK